MPYAWHNLAKSKLDIFQPDPFHTLFGLAGLALLGDKTLAPVDAVFCMPKYTLKEKSLC